VAERRGILAVCEVKSRGREEALDEVLTAAQRERIVRAAAAFVAGRPELAQHAVRFDLVAISDGRWPPRVRHLTGAFAAGVGYPSSRRRAG
jgi:putative endonuclease